MSNFTYEQARDELVEIVAKLEAGTATLDESMGLWERGEALAARCQELLDGARDRITASRGDGEDGTEAEGSADDGDDDPADAGIIGFASTAEEDE